MPRRAAAVQPDEAFARSLSRWPPGRAHGRWRRARCAGRVPAGRPAAGWRRRG